MSKGEEGYSYTTIKSEYSTKQVDLADDSSSFKRLNEWIKDCAFKENHGNTTGIPLVVAYLDYKVLIGRYENNELTFCNNEAFKLKHLQRLRVFNSSSELLLIKVKPCQFKARVRSDDTDTGSEVGVIDAHQVLWGTKTIKNSNNGSGSLNGWVHITEDRGTSLTLPLPCETKVVRVNDKDKRVKLKIRNYIGYNELGQAGFVDCRFVGILFPT